MRRVLVDQPQRAFDLDAVLEEVCRMLGDRPPPDARLLQACFGRLARDVPGIASDLEVRTAWWTALCQAWTLLGSEAPGVILDVVIPALKATGVDVRPAELLESLEAVAGGPDPGVSWLRTYWRDGRDLAVLLESRVGKGDDTLWDRVLGIETQPEVVSGDPGEPGRDGRVRPGRGLGVNRDGVWYEPTPWTTLGRVLRGLRPLDGEVLVDLGCGAGRVLCVLATEPLEAAIGLELQPELAERAQANARRARGIVAPVMVQEVDLGEEGAVVDVLGRGTVLFLFNSFGERTLRRVLSVDEASGGKRRLVAVGRPPGR